VVATIATVGFVMFLPVPGHQALPEASAAVIQLTASLEQMIPTSSFDPGSPDPSGVTYLPDGRLMVTDSEVDETTGAGYHGINLWRVALDGSDAAEGTTVPFSVEPTGLGSDAATNTLFISDDDKNRIFVVRPGGDGRFGTGDDQVSSINVSTYGSGDAEDPAFDPTTGHLFWVDGVSTEVYEIDPVNGIFGDAGDSVHHFDVGKYGPTDVEGLGFHPQRNTLFVGDRKSKKIYEINKAGDQLVTVIDASAIPGMRRISGLTVAPASGNPTTMHLWTVDRGVDNGSSSSENDGRLFELSVPGLGNVPPSVDAGPDQTITLPNAAVLAGTVTDDGLPTPPGVTTIGWSMVSGPGAVTFGDSGSPSTTASFSTDGTYVLRLSGNDSEALSTDDLTVVVRPEGSVDPLQLELRVAASSDDAEERPSGGVALASTDLELVLDGTRLQTVGIRFRDVGIPVGATIVSAYVQFQADEVSTGATTLVIEGQAADNAGTFTTARWDITTRSRTTAEIGWVPAPWNTKNQVGPNQATPDLSAVIQEIVSRPGWAPGNALALIISGTGRRTAEAFDGTAAPILYIEYTS
jgi:sugar lactone lactonase YvrE